jgi:phosphoglycolate phosphatase-like HAD superfamily hydrolase
MRRYGAYLFDFDGTLFDTCASLVMVYRQAFQAIGQDCTADDVAFYIHQSLSQTLDCRHIQDPALRQRFTAVVDQAIDEPVALEGIVIFPDVKPTLESLRKAGVPLGIVSGNSVHHIALVLHRFGLEDAFSFVIGASKSRRPKPYGDAVRAALAFLPSLAPSDVLYIGDSLQDPQEALHGGVTPLLLERHGEYGDYAGEKIARLSDLLS